MGGGCTVTAGWKVRWTEVVPSLALGALCCRRSEIGRTRVPRSDWRSLLACNIRYLILLYILWRLVWHCHGNTAEFFDQHMRPTVLVCTGGCSSSPGAEISVCTNVACTWRDVQHLAPHKLGGHQPFGFDMRDHETKDAKLI